MAMQRIEIIGNLGKDAEVRTVGQSVVVAFNVAVTEKVKSKDGNVSDVTSWYSCNYWPKEDRVSQYLKKGSQVYVAGRPSVRTYTAKDGSQGAAMEVRVSELILVGGKPEGQNAQSRPAVEAPRYNAPAQEAPKNNDLPF